MPLVSFHELMTDAQRGQYAVGYFESWNLESLLAVADAAEELRSPVILGFSGIYLPHPERIVRDPLSAYAVLGLEVCRRLSVPACLLFNESPHLDRVEAAIEAGFNLVMFSNETYSQEQNIATIRDLVCRAHRSGAAVEAEMRPLAGVAGDLRDDQINKVRLTDVPQAARFVEQTGIDALAVDLGQCHLHGRRKMRLNLDLLEELNSLPVPLVLHGATSIERSDLRAAIERGIRKINVGSLLKQSYLEAMRLACGEIKTDSNPYEVIGSGLRSDILVAGRLAMQRAVEELMRLFGSAGKAPAGGLA